MGESMAWPIQGRAISWAGKFTGPEATGGQGQGRVRARDGQTQAAHDMGRSAHASYSS